MRSGTFWRSRRRPTTPTTPKASAESVDSHPVIPKVVRVHLPEGVGEGVEEAPEGPGGVGVATEAGQEGEEGCEHAGEVPGEGVDGGADEGETPGDFELPLHRLDGAAGADAAAALRRPARRTLHRSNQLQGAAMIAQPPRIGALAGACPDDDLAKAQRTQRKWRRKMGAGSSVARNTRGQVGTNVSCRAAGGEGFVFPAPFQGAF